MTHSCNAHYQIIALRYESAYDQRSGSVLANAIWGQQVEKRRYSYLNINLLTVRIAIVCWGDACSSSATVTHEPTALCRRQFGLRYCLCTTRVICKDRDPQ